MTTTAHDPLSGLQPYCTSRFRTLRRHTREVLIGHVGVGGSNPIRIQSMTTTPTTDVAATVRQSIALAEAGCEIIRITAQNKAAAKALKDIHREFRAAGFENPLVADIHFLPSAAMESVEHVEKVRVNPGNYADKKKFDVREYSDAEYDAEIQRLYDAFSPLVKRAKALGRALRIGTNHGSLSDRIMNRYGDTPLGMVESALEFIRIAESHGFRDIVLSMKASNPKVMIEAYRLTVSKMLEEDMHYPLHLGVTEAGDGDEARIKSSIGIGSLLYDGLGDTIRVSLTEDPVYEIPVAFDIARKAEALWARCDGINADADDQPPFDSINPFVFKKREVARTDFANDAVIDQLEPPVVILSPVQPLSDSATIIREVARAKATHRDAPVEGLHLRLTSPDDLPTIETIQKAVGGIVGAFVLEPTEDDPTGLLSALDGLIRPKANAYWLLVDAAIARAQPNAISTKIEAGWNIVLSFSPETIARDHDWPQDVKSLSGAAPGRLMATMAINAGKSGNNGSTHIIGHYRRAAECFSRHRLNLPIWIRNTADTRQVPKAFFGDQLIDASILSGSLICDGIGDAISVETVEDLPKQLGLAYNILQGSRARTVKTEYVACPSCGRTLFDLQSTTQKIRAKTGHLKGVTIAVMGCIVNGPGEMADADFGYVGGAPGKVNLYVGKECVRYHIPEAEAVDRLIDLIHEHGKWIEPGA